MFVGADITYDPVLIKDVCAALLLMMKALGRAIDVYITATARTQVLQPLPPPPPYPHVSSSLSPTTMRTGRVSNADGVRRAVRF